MTIKVLSQDSFHHGHHGHHGHQGHQPIRAIMAINATRTIRAISAIRVTRAIRVKVCLKLFQKIIGFGEQMEFYDSLLAAAASFFFQHGPVKIEEPFMALRPALLSKLAIVNSAHLLFTPSSSCSHCAHCNIALWIPPPPPVHIVHIADHHQCIELFPLVVTFAFVNVLWNELCNIAQGDKVCSIFID